MRLKFVLPLFILFSLTVVVVMAQEDVSPEKPTPTPTASNSSFIESSQNTLKSLDAQGPFVIQAGVGADTCSEATLVDSAGDGSTMDVADSANSISALPAAEDPVLNCVWGGSSQGYRTVWYQFVPEYNGQMTISAVLKSSISGSKYDPVLAVHTGACGVGTLTTVACSDDHVAFDPSVSIIVQRDITYYIEVVDRTSAGSGDMEFQLVVENVPFTSLWQETGQMVGGASSPAGRTRHTTVIDGTDIFVIGGQTSIGNLLSDVWRLDTTNNQWQQLASFPASLVNTTAANVQNSGDDGRIYVPGGSQDVNDQFYSAEHWYYDIQLKNWFQAANDVGQTDSNPNPTAFAYAAAAPNNLDTGYFVTGGVVGQGYPLTTTSTVLNHVLFYDPSDDSWIEREPMISPRYGHVAANVDGILCVTGGLNIDAGQTVLIPNGECASGTSPSQWFPTANMNFPRYFAHSSVGPDGKWYVYGGIGSDADGFADIIPEVEVYDPDTNEWTVMGMVHDLGGQDGDFPVVWPRGGFVDDYLWSLGGSYDLDNTIINTINKKMRILSGDHYLPIVMNNQSQNNHTLGSAYPIFQNQAVSQNFDQITYNFYSFNLSEMQSVRVDVTNVASNSSLYLYVYDGDKVLRAWDEEMFPIGMDKSLQTGLENLLSGRYYVMVRHVLPSIPDSSHYYNLRVSRVD